LDTIAIQRCIILAAPLKTLCRIVDAFGRRLEIVFHEHADGTRHSRPMAITIPTIRTITEMKNEFRS
jgi:hypothetical protein